MANANYLYKLHANVMLKRLATQKLTALKVDPVEYHVQIHWVLSAVSTCMQCTWIISSYWKTCCNVGVLKVSKRTAALLKIQEKVHF